MQMPPGMGPPGMMGRGMPPNMPPPGMGGPPMPFSALSLWCCGFLWKSVFWNMTLSVFWNMTLTVIHVVCALVFACSETHTWNWHVKTFRDDGPRNAATRTAVERDEKRGRGEEGGEGGLRGRWVSLNEVSLMYHPQRIHWSVKWFGGVAIGANKSCIDSMGTCGRTHGVTPGKIHLENPDAVLSRKGGTMGTGEGTG